MATEFLDINPPAHLHTEEQIALYVAAQALKSASSSPQPSQSDTVLLPRLAYYGLAVMGYRFVEVGGKTVEQLNVDDLLNYGETPHFNEQIYPLRQIAIHPQYPFIPLSNSSDFNAQYWTLEEHTNWLKAQNPNFKDVEFVRLTATETIQAAIGLARKYEVNAFPLEESADSVYVRTHSRTKDDGYYSIGRLRQSRDEIAIRVFSNSPLTNVHMLAAVVSSQEPGLRM